MKGEIRIRGSIRRFISMPIRASVRPAKTRSSIFFVSGPQKDVRQDLAFETAYYVQAYPDVAASGLNPLTHFVLVGKAEGRRTCALPSPNTSAAGDIQAFARGIRDSRQARA